MKRSDVTILVEDTDEELDALELAKVVSDGEQSIYEAIVETDSLFNQAVDELKAAEEKLEKAKEADEPDEAEVEALTDKCCDAAVEVVDATQDALSEVLVIAGDLESVVDCLLAEYDLKLT